MIIDKAAKDLELDTKLRDSFGGKKQPGSCLTWQPIPLLQKGMLHSIILIMLTTTRFLLQI